MTLINETMSSFLQLISMRAPAIGVTYSRSDLIYFFHTDFANKSDFSEVIDLLFYHEFMNARKKNGIPFEDYYLTLRGLEFGRNPSLFSLEDLNSLSELRKKIESTDWTGLARNVSPAHSRVIREKSQALLSAIIQSDADIQTRTDACKRVEAVIVLLDAPNAPWREIVDLLNHPTVTAFFAAVSLLQFLLGIGT